METSGWDESPFLLRRRGAGRQGLIAGSAMKPIYNVENVLSYIGEVLTALQGSASSKRVRASPTLAPNKLRGGILNSGVKCRQSHLVFTRDLSEVAVRCSSGV